MLCPNFMVIIVFVKLVHFGEAINCFQCKGVPFPRDCSRLVGCGPHETCYTEQIVTTSGHIVYNSGCQQKDMCISGSSNVIGRRDDITVCKECCYGDYCNNQGCGTKVASRDERGPYCFNCDASLHPSSCEEVTICKKDEQCLVYIPFEFVGLPEGFYRSSCQTTAVCSAFALTQHTGICPPICCNDDFCNDYCNTSAVAVTPTAYTLPSTAVINPVTGQHVITTTRIMPTVVETSPLPIVTNIMTTGAATCDTSNGYISIDTHTSTQLCLRIYLNRLTWSAAKRRCEDDGGRLVVLDTVTKSHPVRVYLERNYRSGNFWIGGTDTHLNDVFYWINGQPMDLHQDDWDAGQPNHHDAGKDQNCVRMLPGRYHHLWHDQFCNDHNDFICERV